MKIVVVVLALMLFFLLTGCTERQIRPEIIVTGTGIELASPEPKIINSPTDSKCEDNVGRLIDSRTSVPSPQANVKYVTQQNNVFQVKYGDGKYTMASPKSGLFHIDCENGDSMLPMFDCNDYILLQKVENIYDVFVGDVVIFEREGGQSIMHRVVKIEFGKYYVKGDNLATTTFTDGLYDPYTEFATFDELKYKVVGIVYS